MWLRDSLSHDFKQARILLYGYDTSLLRSETFQTIDDVAIEFCKRIKSIRRNNNVSNASCFLKHVKLIETGSTTASFDIHFT